MRTLLSSVSRLLKKAILCKVFPSPISSAKTPRTVVMKTFATTGFLFSDNPSNLLGYGPAAKEILLDELDYAPSVQIPRSEISDLDCQIAELMYRPEIYELEKNHSHFLRFPSLLNLDESFWSPRQKYICSDELI